MRPGKLSFGTLGLIVLFSHSSSHASSYSTASDIVRLYSGFISKIRCEGRLLVSAIGNDTLVRLEPLPKELGCGVLLKPTSERGRTNLVLKTSAGTVKRIVLILNGSDTKGPHVSELEIQVKGDSE